MYYRPRRNSLAGADCSLYLRVVAQMQRWPEHRSLPSERAIETAPKLGALAERQRLERLASAVGNRAFSALVARRTSPVPKMQTMTAARGSRVLQREDLADDPFPSTEDGDQPGMLSLSDDGFEFLKRHEGVRLNLYNDSQGHCTIGVGHLVHKGNCNGSEPQEYKNGLTEDQVDDLFRSDLEVYETAVSGGITSRINQYQYDALVSFAFNVGTGAFRGSGVLKQVNAKQYSKVPGEFMKWVKPPEIKGRRKDEAALFKDGAY